MISEADKTVVVAMSGGVDSCAAAVLLAEQGYKIIGVSMQVWDYRKNGGNSKRATCCAPADFEDARAVAEQYGFPYYVFDFEDSFQQEVISPFVESYKLGLTPNPCLDCNRKVKFRELRHRASALGVEVVATGHYAQIRKQHSSSGERFGLYTSVDSNKDQSYFLYAMTQADLSRTLFPVGGMKKPIVRDVLQSRALEVADKAESQDICFVEGKVSEFIERHGGVRPKKGLFVLADGTAVGEHEGVHHFTVGQRKGMGISHPNPLYVIEIDASENRVVVGEKEQLERRSFYVQDVNWISGSVPVEPFSALVKLRYRHAGVLCTIQPVGSKAAMLSFESEWTPVTPGQAAVFYQTEFETEADLHQGIREVIGGGIISQAPERCEEVVKIFEEGEIKCHLENQAQ